MQMVPRRDDENGDRPALAVCLTETQATRPPVQASCLSNCVTLSKTSQGANWSSSVSSRFRASLSPPRPAIGELASSPARSSGTRPPPSELSLANVECREQSAETGQLASANPRNLELGTRNVGLWGRARLPAATRDIIKISPAGRVRDDIFWWPRERPQNMSLSWRASVSSV